MTILFSTVEMSNNYIFGDEMTPTAPEKGQHVTKFVQYLHTIFGYWEVCRHFSGAGGIFYGWEFPIGMEVSRG